MIIMGCMGCVSRETMGTIWGGDICIQRLTPINGRLRSLRQIITGTSHGERSMNHDPRSVSNKGVKAKKTIEK